MAFTPTLKEAISAIASTVGPSTAFTPANGALLVVIIGTKRSTALPVTPIVTDSLGLTWTEIIDFPFETGSNPRMRTAAFYTVIGTGASMTITGNGGTSVGYTAMTILEFAGWGGATPDFTNQIGDSDTAGDPSCVLPSAPDATSCVICGANVQTSASLTKTASYTSLHNTAIPSSSGQFAACFDDASPAQTVGYTSTSLASVAIAFELKVAAGGTTYNEARVEALTVAETQTGLGAFPKSLAETLAAAETQSGLGVFGKSVAEVITVAASQNATGVFAKSLAESITVVDAQTGGLLQTGAVAETLNAVASQAAAHSLIGARAEILSAVDGTNVTLAALGARAEVLAAVDTQSAVGVFEKSVVEVLAAVETVNGNVPVLSTARNYAMIIG